MVTKTVLVKVEKCKIGTIIARNLLKT